VAKGIVHSALITLIACLVGPLAQPASAAAPDVTSVTVRYADLNLASSDGVRTLYRRLKAASQQVCQPYESRELTRHVRWRACYDAALSGAVAELDVSMLTRLHDRSPARPRYRDAAR